MTIYTSFDEIPRGHYRLVVSDIPWGFRNKKTGGSGKSGASSHYPTMDIDEILALPIPDICAKDCTMFQWVPDSLLDMGIDVFKHYGFAYKGVLVWDKQSIGMGWWYRNQTEHCIYGVRGKAKAFHMQRPNIFRAKRTGHSRKPDVFWERYVYPLAADQSRQPCIELFARETRSGWDCFGNEVVEILEKED